MHINNPKIHNVNRTHAYGGRLDNFVRLLVRLVLPFLLAICVTVNGCSSVAEPTRLAIVKTATNTQVKPSATFTPRPSQTPAATMKPTVVPTATPTQPPPTQEPVYYIVKAGDYIEAIALAFGITVGELLSANGLTADEVLITGDKLLIPVHPEPTAVPDNTQQANPPKATPELSPVTVVHIVQEGDTIDTIAAQYGVTWEKIAAANGIEKQSILSIGQELTIPNVAVTPETTIAPDNTGSSTPESAPTSEAVTSTPAKVTYIVSQGDYIELIAERYGITSDQLAEANGISANDVLQIGQELIIPNQSATAEPTRTPTLTPTPTLTMVSRILPTTRPTLTDTQTYPYQQPLLLAPVNNTVFEGADASILLNWISVGILASNEWYQVRIWKNDTQDAPQIYYTKATSWRPPLGFYNSDNAPYTLRWQVIVVNSVMEDSTFTQKSPASAIYSFYWR